MDLRIMEIHSAVMCLHIHSRMETFMWKKRCGIGVGIVSFILFKLFYTPVCAMFLFTDVMLDDFAKIWFSSWVMRWKGLQKSDFYHLKHSHMLNTCRVVCHIIHSKVSVSAAIHGKTVVESFIWVFKSLYLRELSNFQDHWGCYTGG
jgi:hypothetical protein